jgi:hypothetical protein
MKMSRTRTVTTEPEARAATPDMLISDAQRALAETEAELAALEGEESELEKKRKIFQAKKDEIGKRQYDARIRLVAAHGELVLQNVDLFLALTPEHAHRDCSDTNLSDIYEHDEPCTRCLLLRSKRQRYWDNEYDIEIKIVKTGA